jgi:hypothetical protein
VKIIRKSKGLPAIPSKGTSYEETLMLFNSNYSVEAIAKIKDIGQKTVYEHIALLIKNRRITDFSRIITREQYDRVIDVSKKNKMYMYLILSHEMPLGLPAVALAIAEVLGDYPPPFK